MRKMLYFLLAASLVACQVNQPVTEQAHQAERTFSTLSTSDISMPKDESYIVKAEPSASPGSEPSRAESPPAGRPKDTRTGTGQAEARPELTFKNLALLNSSNYNPGVVTVVYDNSHRVRIQASADKSVFSVQATHAETQRKVNQTLQAHDLRYAQDLLYESLSPRQAQQDFQRMQRTFDGYIPERQSVHIYSFAEDADIISITESLRNIPGVVAANPSLKSDIASVSVQHLASHSKDEVIDPKTGPVYHRWTDPLFYDFYDNEEYWWWYNAQKVFHAWDYYDSTAKPYLAIIDNGFDTTVTAKDKPNYYGGAYVHGCSASGSGPYTYSGCTIESGLDKVLPPTGINGRTTSHGTMVSSIAASPLNNWEGLAGVAPGAYVYPIRTELNEADIARSILLASSQTEVDAINLSLNGYFDFNEDGVFDASCPHVMYSNEVHYETGSAVANNKVVVYAAGNLQTDFDNIACNLSNAGSIIVGGSDHNTYSLLNLKGWEDSATVGTSYTSSSGNKIHLAAASNNIYLIPNYDSINDISYYTNLHPHDSGFDAGASQKGTSLGAPMVTATAGMMKRLAQANGYSLSPLEVRSLITFGSDLFRYSPAGNASPETKFVGEDLVSQTGSPKLVGMRNLNVYHALILAKNMYDYPVISRISNIDDAIYASINWDWSGQQYDVKGYKMDSFNGFNGLQPYDKLSFYTRNEFASSGYAYHYQVFRNKMHALETFDGVAGVLGAENNQNFPIGWYAPWEYVY